MLVVPFQLAYSVYIYRFTLGSYKEILRLLKVTGSPIGNLYAETMSGNSTIRAFNSAEASNFKYQDCQNVNQLANEISVGTWVWYSM